MLRAEPDTGTASDAFLRIDHLAVVRIDGTDRADLRTDPALDIPTILNNSQNSVPKD